METPIRTLKDYLRELSALRDMLNAPQSIGLWKVTVFTSPKRLAALDAAIRALSNEPKQKTQIARLRKEVRELSGYLDRNGL